MAMIVGYIWSKIRYILRRFGLKRNSKMHYNNSQEIIKNTQIVTMIVLTQTANKDRKVPQKLALE